MSSSAFTGVDTAAPASIVSTLSAIHVCLAMSHSFQRQSPHDVDQSRLSLTIQTLGGDNRFKLLLRLLDILIDNDVVVLRPAADLVVRFRHPAGHYLLAVLSSFAQPALQFGA